MYLSDIYTFALILIILCSYWTRMISTAAPGCQQRFISYFDFYFQSVAEQARDRDSGVIPDLESYIALRRDTSGMSSAHRMD